MSAAAQFLPANVFPANVLPFVWAIGAQLPVLPYASESAPDLQQPRVHLYRKYTEAMLRRYIRMAMEAGKVPSLIGKEMFRGNVTNYQIGHFDDAVIFVHDVDRCLDKLEPPQKDLITRIAIQQYTISEAADLLRLPPRSVVRRYGVALDLLTDIFLSVGMLEPQKFCQGG